LCSCFLRILLSKQEVDFDLNKKKKKKKIKKGTFLVFLEKQVKYSVFLDFPAGIRQARRFFEKRHAGQTALPGRRHPAGNFFGKRHAGTACRSGICRSSGRNAQLCFLTSVLFFLI
jgi:hypothetical protein